MEEHYHYFCFFYAFINGDESYINAVAKEYERVNRRILKRWEKISIEGLKKFHGERVIVLLRDFKEISCDCEDKNVRD